jgi:hypothetical protein
MPAAYSIWKLGSATNEHLEFRIRCFEKQSEKFKSRSELGWTWSGL